MTMMRLIMDIFRQKDKEFLDYCANTSEQVTPAAVKGSGDVEQQAEEEVVQLPAPLKG